MTKQPTPLSHRAPDKDKVPPVPPVPAAPPVPPAPPRLTPTVWLEKSEDDGSISPISEVFRSSDPAAALVMVETIFRPGWDASQDRKDGEIIPMDQISGKVEWRYSPLAYVVSESGETRIQPELKLGEWRLVPRPDKCISELFVLFPSGLSEYGSTEELAALLQAFIHTYCDVPEFWEKLMVAYILMTWVFDVFDSVPYLRYLGEWQSGKTRFTDVLAHLCYKTMFTGGASTPAVMFRMMDKYRGTMYADEAQWKDSGPDCDIIKILNMGYRRQGGVLRCNENNEVVPFRVFGPKVLTNRTRFKDPATESRCLTMQTHEHSVRADIPVQLHKSFYAEALELRNKLLQFRFRTYPVLDGVEFEETLKNLDNRQREITLPLLVVMQHDKAFAGDLQEFCGERRTEERGERLEAVIVESVRMLVEKRLGKSGWEAFQLSRSAKPEIVLTVKDTAAQATLLLQMREPEIVKTTPRGANSAGANANTGEEPPALCNAHRTGRALRNLGFKPVKKKLDTEYTLTPHKWAELDALYPAAPPSSEGGLVPVVGGRAGAC